MGTAGIVILLVIGLTFVAIALLDTTRGTPVSRVVTRGDGETPEVSDPAFRVAMECYTLTSMSPGHTIELLPNGAVYDRLWADIRSARTFVAVQMYYCKPGRVADALHDALVDRARAGVDVLFLYDAFGTSLKDEYIESLKAAGVEAAKFRALRPHMLHTVHHRAHLRAVVIDGEVGYTGGFGIDDKWLGDGVSGWRDTNVRFTGPAVAQLLAAFASCWTEPTGDLIAGRRWWSTAARAHERAEATQAFDAPVAGLLHGTPTVGSTPAERFFALTIASARRTLWITNSYFVPDDDFRRLVKQAAGRGVDVRILTANRRSDVRSTHLAARARYEELLEAGVRIWEYQPAMVHAKSVVVDGRWASVGSMNTDNRSMAFNNECNLVALDPEFASALERMFLDDLTRSEEIDLEAFRRRGWRRRALEQGAHLMSRIL